MAKQPPRPTSGATQPLIDPAAALAVLVSAAPRTYAFFLGSAVSSPTIPTGQEVRRDTLALIYKAQTKQTPDAGADLDSWWRSRAGAQATYSSMLESVFPTTEERRRYLAGFFEGKQPNPTHKEFARMAKRGLIDVFVTTNFDRLLEKALEEEGLSVVAVSFGEQVKAAPPREHAEVYVLKLHGDYGSGRIRNTDRELEKLDPEMETEFGLVLERYGLVVLGYAGEDAAVVRLLRGRGTRYGLYWVVRGSPSKAQSELVSSIGGQFIHADQIEPFLEDVQHRIAALATQPDGRLPGQH